MSVRTGTRRAMLKKSSATSPPPPPPATHLLVTPPGSATVGTACTFTVAAKDASNNTVTGYSDTVTLTCSDAVATLNAPFTLTSGVGSPTVNFGTAGNDTVTATDTHNLTGNATIAVSAPDYLLATFTAANNTSLDAYTPETGPVGVLRNGTFWIQSNHAEPHSNADSNVVTWDIGVTDDWIATVNMTPQDDGTKIALPGFVLNYVDANNLWFVQLDSLNDKFQLYSRISGSYTQRAVASVALVAGTSYAVQITKRGAFVTATLNGANTLTYNVVNTGTASTLVGFRLGLGDAVNAPASKVQWDDAHVYKDSLALTLWTKYRNNVDPTVINPSSGNEAVIELDPWNSSLVGSYVGVATQYANGGATHFVRRYTSADGLTWTDQGIIIGNGTGGQSGNTCRPRTIIDSGTTWLFYVDANVNGKLNLASSTDDVTWTRQATDLVPLTSSILSIENTCCVKQGSTYYLFVEYEAADHIYRTGLWTASSVSGPYTMQNLTLPTLDVGGMYGHPAIIYDSAASLWHNWYHAATSGNLPTQIYHAVASAPGGPWTQRGAQMRITEAPSVLGGFQCDQNADPGRPLQVGSETWLYYDCDENTGGAAGVCLAKYAGTLANLLTQTTF